MTPFVSRRSGKSVQRTRTIRIDAEVTAAINRQPGESWAVAVRRALTERGLLK